MELSAFDFPIANIIELHQHLQLKQKEYFVRIKGSEKAWDHSWYTMDLLARHDQDPEFRLRYYKFVLISIFIMAYHKHAALTKSGNEVEDCVSARCVGVDLSHALCRNLDVETFNEACEVMMAYLTGTLKLETSATIPIQT